MQKSLTINSNWNDAEGDYSEPRTLQLGPAQGAADSDSTESSALPGAGTSGAREMTEIPPPFNVLPLITRQYDERCVHAWRCTLRRKGDVINK